jgi:cytochrome c553
LCAGGITVGARAQDAPPGDTTNGKRVYLNDNCFTCHGRAGQGGAYNGPAPALAKTAMPFEGFLGQIRNPSNDMPAYSAQVMPDQAVADIYAYMQALPGLLARIRPSLHRLRRVVGALASAAQTAPSLKSERKRSRLSANWDARADSARVIEMLAMKGADFVWDKEKLDRFIAKPDEVVPGNNMKPYGGTRPAARF